MMFFKSSSWNKTIKKAQMNQISARLKFESDVARKKYNEEAMRNDAIYFKE